MKKLTLAGLIAGVALSAAVATSDAGLRYTYEVTETGAGLYGAMGDASRSRDSRQFIGCGLRYNGGVAIGYCSGRANTSRGTVSCTTRDPAMIDVIKSINSDSVIVFVPRSGVCTTLSINTSSAHISK